MDPINLKESLEFQLIRKTAAHIADSLVKGQEKLKGGPMEISLGKLLIFVGAEITAYGVNSCEVTEHQKAIASAIRHIELVNEDLELGRKMRAKDDV